MTRTEFRRLFAAERRRFMAHFPLMAADREGGPSVLVLESVCPLMTACSPRDLAVTMDDDGGHTTIAVVARLLAMPRNSILGVIRHELGHAALWGFDHSEQDADDAAEDATGEKIRYDRNDVQTVGRGAYPRPRHLHR